MQHTVLPKHQAWFAPILMGRLHDWVKGLRKAVEEGQGKIKDKYATPLREIDTAVKALMDLNDLVMKKGCFKWDAQGQPLIKGRELQFIDELDDPIISNIFNTIKTQTTTMMDASIKLFKVGSANHTLGCSLLVLCDEFFNKHHRASKQELEKRFFIDYYLRMESRKKKYLQINSSTKQGSSSGSAVSIIEPNSSSTEEGSDLDLADDALTRQKQRILELEQLGNVQAQFYELRTQRDFMQQMALRRDNHQLTAQNKELLAQQALMAALKAPELTPWWHYALALVFFLVGLVSAMTGIAAFLALPLLALELSTDLGLSLIILGLISAAFSATYTIYTALQDQSAQALHEQELSLVHSAPELEPTLLEELIKPKSLPLPLLKRRATLSDVTMFNKPVPRPLETSLEGLENLEGSLGETQGILKIPGSTRAT